MHHHAALCENSSIASERYSTGSSVVDLGRPACSHVKQVANGAVGWERSASVCGVWSRDDRPSFRTIPPQRHPPCPQRHAPLLLRGDLRGALPHLWFRLRHGGGGGGEVQG